MTPNNPFMNLMSLPQLPNLMQSLLSQLNPQQQQQPRHLPRPLPLHLLQALTYARPWVELMGPQSMHQPSVPSWPQSFPAAWTGFPPASFASKPSSTGSASCSNNNHPDLDPASLLSASLKLAGDELGAWCRGVELYANALRPALPAKPPVIWQEGTTVVRDYSGPPPSRSCGTIIVIPSLVNRAAILDLLPGQSFLRHLAGHGRVLLVDWDAPGPDELAFGIDDYIARLLTIISKVQAEGGRVHLLGYCMGGLLALAAAQLAEQPIDRIALLATPWDFSAYNPGARLGIAQWQMALTPWLAAGQPVPVDILQALFALLQPMATYDKFKRAGKNGIDDTFIAVEDWLNDGVPLPARVAQTCFGDWFGMNSTVAGQWRVGGQAIDPAKITAPTLLVTPQKDQLVPPASASALALPQGTMLAPELGHIGMIVGRQARTAVWEPVARFFAAR